MMLIALTVSAQAISQEEALERVNSFLKSTPTAGRRALSNAQLDAVTTTLPHLYVFNVKDGGFVIASGDGRALPVLGYSTTGSFDWNRMPENMRAWLRGYGEAIENLGDIQLTNTTTRRTTRTKIEPIVTSQWNQAPVYNELCPKYNGQVTEAQNKLCLTGCTATAMAQVMNYYQWPQTATSQIPAYTYNVSNVKEGVSEDFSAEALPAVTFDWNNMLNRYLDEEDKPLASLTEAQVKAVATLMRYCGQSVLMKYSTVISLAYGSNVADALRRYFNYDNTARCVNRAGYTIEQWEDLIYNELANKRPVVYGGASDEGGHSFICDGYDSNGMFHINWGWEGYADNYFSLSVLNPSATNVLGVTRPGIGFSISQEAVIGIQPNKTGTASTPVVPEMCSTSHFFVIDGVDNEKTPVYYLAIPFECSTFLSSDAEFEIGLFYEENGTWKNDLGQTMKITMKNHNSNYFAPYYYKSVDPSKVPDFTKRLYPRYRCTSVQGAEWQLFAGGNYYFEYTVKNGNVTITAMPSANALKITKSEITGGTGTVASKSNLTLTIQNSGATDYDGTLVLLPISIGNEDPATAEASIRKMSNSDPLPTGWTMEESIVSGAYLKANATGTVPFAFTPRNTGNYLLLLYEVTGHNDIRVVHFAYTSVNIKAATGISETMVKTTNDDTFYDLQGRRVSESSMANGQPLKPGLYIKNGRKYAIK